MWLLPVGVEGIVKLHHQIHLIIFLHPLSQVIIVCRNLSYRDQKNLCTNNNAYRTEHMLVSPPTKQTVWHVKSHQECIATKSIEWHIPLWLMIAQSNTDIWVIVQNNNIWTVYVATDFFTTFLPNIAEISMLLYTIIYHMPFDTLDCYYALLVSLIDQLTKISGVGAKKMFAICYAQWCLLKSWQISSYFLCCYCALT